MSLNFFKALLLASICVHLSLWSENFVLFTEPKTGTHLLIPVLTALTGKKVFWAKKYQEETKLLAENKTLTEDPQDIYFSSGRAPWNRKTMDQIWAKNEKNGTFLHLHAPFTVTLENYLLEHSCINFFIKRDPRDQIVSLLNHYKHIHLNDPSLASIVSDDEKLLLMIRKDLRRETLYFKGWVHSPACCTLDFSKLMGNHGGAATDLDALGELKKIAAALKVDISDQDLYNVYKSNFGKGYSFFKGKVGAWKEYFKEEHKTAVKEEIGDLLIELGYEQDFNW
ncbi:MAG: hypothetical protein WCF19_04860 [Chlamydiales bacterium]